MDVIWMNIDENRLNAIVEELTKQGYFKYGNGGIKRYSKVYGGFEPISINIFMKLLQDYLTSEQVFHYHSKIVYDLPAFPDKEWWNYQDYMRAKDEPSFKEVLNRFLKYQYEENQKKKTEPIDLNKNPINIRLDDIMQVLINNDIFVDRVYYGYGFFKYDIDNAAFIPVTKDNFMNYTGINSKDVADYLFRRINQSPTYKLTNLNGLVDGFSKAKKRDLILKKNKSDYEYINSLKDSIRNHLD